MAGGSILVSDHVEERHASALEAAASGIPRCVLRPSGPSSDPSEVEVAFFSGDLFPARTRDFVITVAKSERLHWLHTFSAGVDHPWFRTLRQRGVRITTSSGAAAVPIAQSVILYLLALSRNSSGGLDRGIARFVEVRVWSSSWR